MFDKWWHYLKYSPTDPHFYADSAPKVVAIGGGTGLSSLLRGLKQITPNITAIVAVTDNGQSSGRLRKLYDTLPPGDIRQCIAALSPDEDVLTKLMNYRFKKGDGLKGHALGNLLMVALADQSGGFDRAIIRLSEILRITGRVMPVSLGNIQLNAKLKSGQVVVGEEQISLAGHDDPIDRVFLPHSVRVYPPAVQAILEADLIIIGPGSLYTSVIPPLLFSGITKALKSSLAVKAYVCNISTERGETEGYSVQNHIEKIVEVVGKNVVNFALVNKNHVRSNQIPEGELGSIKVISTRQSIIEGVRIKLDSVSNSKQPLYHDSIRLAEVLIMEYNEIKKRLKR